MGALGLLLLVVLVVVLLDAARAEDGVRDRRALLGVLVLMALTLILWAGGALH